MKKFFDDYSIYLLVIFYVSLFTLAYLGLLPEWMTRSWYE